MSIRFSGEMKIVNNMHKSAVGVKKGSAEAARKLMDSVYKESQHLVPVQTTALKTSARITEREANDKVTITIHYGSVFGIRDSSAYAVYVHEDLSLKHAPGKSAKFVEIPFFTHAFGAMPVFKMYVMRYLTQEVRG